MNSHQSVEEESHAYALIDCHGSVERACRVCGIRCEAVRRLQTACGTCADMSTAEGRLSTLKLALQSLGGLDILVNNAGGVRAGRLENTSPAEIEQMVTVDLLAPILLTRAALEPLRASRDAMVVNIAYGIAVKDPIHSDKSGAGSDRAHNAG